VCVCVCAESLKAWDRELVEALWIIELQNHSSAGWLFRLGGLFWSEGVLTLVDVLCPTLCKDGDLIWQTYQIKRFISQSPGPKMSDERWPPWFIHVAYLTYLHLSPFRSPTPSRTFKLPYLWNCLSNSSEIKQRECFESFFGTFMPVTKVGFPSNSSGQKCQWL
jgi:hypothetical protein